MYSSAFCDDHISFGICFYLIIRLFVKIIVCSQYYILASNLELIERSRSTYYIIVVVNYKVQTMDYCNLPADKNCMSHQPFLLLWIEKLILYPNCIFSEIHVPIKLLLLYINISISIFVVCEVKKIVGVNLVLGHLFWSIFIFFHLVLLIRRMGRI